jgi:serine protease Do
MTEGRPSTAICTPSRGSGLAVIIIIIMAVALPGLLACSASRSKDSSASSAKPVEHDTSSGTAAPAPAFAQATGQTQVTLADVAERVVPSVVNISATRALTRRGQGDSFHGEQFRGDMFGNRPPPNHPPVPQDPEAQSLGSGVIVSADGVLLTNNHVVEQAAEIKVTLSDGREFKAEVVGTDPRSDVAVVRISETVADLQPLPFGDAESLRLGEVVLAVGNPFGVGQTVTMGIVSAKGRSGVGLVDYEDFIQTDAAINPGNSGGALVNMRGELVGVNTAILSRTGGSQGIGFAIPTTMVRPIMDGLLTKGAFTRGHLGVMIQELDKNLAAGLGLSLDRGVVISDVTLGSPANKAGMRRGDVVRTLDGKDVASVNDFRNRIAGLGPGAEVVLGVVREGKDTTLKATLGALQDKTATTASADAAGTGLLAGVTVTSLRAESRAMYSVPAEVTQGVLVTAVKPDSPAQKVGLHAGDVIVEINRKSVDSVAAFDTMSSKLGDSVLLLISRGGNTIFLANRK